jgi:glc operon protein GlcG
MPELDPATPPVPSLLQDGQSTPGISRRQALAMGGGLAAAAAVIGAGPAAATTTPSAGPGDTPDPSAPPSVDPSATPPASPDPGPSTGVIGGTPQSIPSISLEQAQAVLAGALAAVTPDTPPMYVVVIDAGGDVKASARQDGNSPAALTLAPLKAQTALAFRQPTTGLAAIEDTVRLQSFLAAGFTAVGGGLPIRNADGSQVIGAIGVGGGSPEQDVQVAEAGLAVQMS